MNGDDARPKWLLRKLAQISSQRCSTYGKPPKSEEEWWSQIEASAAELKLQTTRHDWERWPP